MPLTATRYEHIVLDERKVPRIAGTNMKVIELVLEHIAYGWSPEEIHFQHPYLSMGQIHSALAYYWDHKEEMDKQIEAELTQLEDLERVLPKPENLIKRLKAKGLL